MSAPTLADLALARQTMTVSGTRVRVVADLDADTAALLLRRGLAELDDEYEAFVPGDAQKCLTVTQYGFDLVLGRLTP
jgi:hypothetical protein